MSDAPTAYRTIWCELIDPETDHYVSGWGAIIEGADVPVETLTTALRDYHSRDTFRVVSEVQHLIYAPRVKWCSPRDGFGCDSEGDWHGHWFGVKHNPASDCCHTLALPVFIPRATSVIPLGTCAADPHGRPCQGGDHYCCHIPPVVTP